MDIFEHGIAHDDVEFVGAANRMFDLPNAWRFGAAFRTITSPEFVLRIGHRGSQMQASHTKLPIGIVVDGNGLQFVDALMQLSHDVRIVVIPQDDIAFDIELVLLFGCQLVRWIGKHRWHDLPHSSQLSSLSR